MSASAWELIFMMFVLKLPILYLIGVVWWAVRATPDPFEPAALVPVETDPEDPTRPVFPCTWRAQLRPRPPRGARRGVASAKARR